MFTIIFGTMLEMKQMSVRDRLERKKYMGVWSWESELMARMMSRFPSTVTRYMDRNRPKRMSCRFDSSDSNKRWNSETRVRFWASMLLAHLLKENGLYKETKCILVALYLF
jgi:IS30 family transposase